MSLHPRIDHSDVIYNKNYVRPRTLCRAVHGAVDLGCRSSRGYSSVHLREFFCSLEQQRIVFYQWKFNTFYENPTTSSSDIREVDILRNECRLYSPTNICICFFFNIPVHSGCVGTDPIYLSILFSTSCACKPKMPRTE